MVQLGGGVGLDEVAYRGVVGRRALGWAGVGYAKVRFTFQILHSACRKVTNMRLLAWPT